MSIEKKKKEKKNKTEKQQQRTKVAFSFIQTHYQTNPTAK